MEMDDLVGPFTLPTATQRVMNFLTWLAKRDPVKRRQISNEELQERAQELLDALTKEKD
jgi:hypothetical protein